MKVVIIYRVVTSILALSVCVILDRYSDSSMKTIEHTYKQTPHASIAKPNAMYHSSAFQISHLALMQSLIPGVNNKTQVLRNQPLQYKAIRIRKDQQLPILSQVAVPLKKSNHALLVDATVQSETGQDGGAFIIDTGATYTSISVQMAKNLGLNLSNSEQISITTANGQINVPKVYLKQLKVNGITVHNIEATVIPISSSANFSGLLGLSFIRQFVVTIDTEGNQLLFQERL